MKQQNKGKLCSNGCAVPAAIKGFCVSCYKKQYRVENRDRMLLLERAAALNNRARRLVSLENYRYSTRGRFGYMTRDSARRGLSCNISREQYYKLLSKPCYYCTREMPESMGTGLDRIDNSKGYEIDNVLTCCGDCNTLRMNKLTVEETKLLAVTLRAFRESKLNEEEANE